MKNVLRVAVPLILLAVAGVMIWWRGPNWHAVGDSFSSVVWWWVAAAIGLNLLSVVARAACWNTTIKQAMPVGRPRFLLVFSAFCVGLLGNAVIPGRVGELARVFVLARRLPNRQSATAILVGSVIAHRMFDLVPVIALVVWVLLTAALPHWAINSLIAVLAAGLAAFAFAWLGARRSHGPVIEELGSIRKLLVQARIGLGVMRAPLPRRGCGHVPVVGWLCQLFAVWAAMRAFGIHPAFAVSGRRARPDERGDDLPALAGQRRLVQAAIGLPLKSCSVPQEGFAFDGFRRSKASVGVGIG